MHDLLAIGQFSQVTRLSVKALRLYDSLGLLKPAWVDPSSGYRYYRPAQARTAETIRVLREVDMSLDDIGDVLASTDTDVVRKYLVAHRGQLEDRLGQQQRMLEFLSSLIEHEGVLMPYQITTKSVPSQHVASVKLTTNLAQIKKVFGPAMSRLTEVVAQSDTDPASPPFVVYHDVIDEHNEGTVELCIPVTTLVTSTDQDVQWKTVDAGQVAFTTHQGPYEQLSPAYHAIGEWLSEHDHDTAAPPREIYLNDPNVVAPNELLTEVQFPIV